MRIEAVGAAIHTNGSSVLSTLYSERVNTATDRTSNHVENGIL